MPAVAIRLGEKFGRLMNYGDGVYGGQFMGGMYAEAFFETDPVKIAEAGLRCIPAESQYAEIVRDLIRWYVESPDDWEKAWLLVQKKYREDPEYQKASNGGIDVKINGAYVLMGLLFGKRDPDRTILISCRSGMDSDCNPSSSAGVLFTTVGYSKLPERFAKELDETRVFAHTAYHFPGLIAVCEKLAREALVRAGGRVERDSSGEEVFVIPMVEPRPSPLELTWAPGPIAGSEFKEDEMARISEGLLPAFKEFAPGWELSSCGPDMDPGLKEEHAGKRKVFLTHPLNQETACGIARTVEIPAGKKMSLRLVVGHHPQGDWDLVVRADGKTLLEKPIGKETAKEGWLEVVVDLSAYAGKRVKLELLNRPSGWAFEAGYWATISLEER
jgi:hypothetical protein